MTDERPEHPEQSDADEMRANPGYALGRLAKALTTSTTHEDPATRARAAEKVRRWVAVFGGMLRGTLDVGSRTPALGTPEWVTLEVVTGGFATGELLAEGPLLPHELSILGRIGAKAGAERATINAYYLSEPGMAELRALLDNGCYRVSVPEEGALLVVAWLLEHGFADEARGVLDEIGPFLSRLRFYPVTAAQRLGLGLEVRLQNVGDSIEELKAVRDRPVFERQRESAEVWNPIYDRIVGIFLETIDGPPPTLKAQANGKPERLPGGRFLVVGGWPCQRYPDSWKARAKEVLADFDAQRANHRRCRRPENPRHNFARLRAHLQRCVDDPRALTGSDVAMIRSMLAGIITKRGMPSGERWQRLRAFQRAQVAGPTGRELAEVLIHRLADRGPDEGLPSPDAVLFATSPDEAKLFGIPEGSAFPRSLVAKVVRCVDGPVEALVEKRIIKSSETLARVIPQVSAQVSAARIGDPNLRRLFGAVYMAFRRRRSLLLFNLERQVKLEDLPWVRAIAGQRVRQLEDRERARQTLEQLVTLSVTSFPHVIFPNKLLQEVRALAESAGLKMPIVEELAADIFMGTFSEKFLHAAQVAASLLEGTLYERYYDIPYAFIRAIDDVSKSRFGAPTSPNFANLCAQRGATPGGDGGRSVALNGKVIEQSQLMTTHNLAVLFQALSLTGRLRPRLPELARHCFEWTCRRLQYRFREWSPRLQSVRRGAYAWRQMIFFLALSPSEDQVEFVTWASDHLAKQSRDFSARFAPALTGLQLAMDGHSPEAGGQRYLGWTTDKHWLLG